MIRRGYIGDELRDPCLVISGLEISRLFSIVTPGNIAKLVIEQGTPWEYNSVTVRCGKYESSIMAITNGMPAIVTMTSVQCLRIGMVGALIKDSRASIRPLSMKIELKQVSI